MRILKLIGGSLQKLDSLFEARDYYQQALNRSPKNLELMLQLRANFNRLNESTLIRAINQRIENTLSPNTIALSSNQLDKGHTFRRGLIFDGRAISLDLEFADRGLEPLPLIAVWFNGRIVWEDYIDSEKLTLLLDTQVGDNDLWIQPVNKAVALVGISWRTGR